MASPSYVPFGFKPALPLLDLARPLGSPARRPCTRRGQAVLVLVFLAVVFIDIISPSHTWLPCAMVVAPALSL